MAAADLPHVPSTIDQLYKRSLDSTTHFSSLLKAKTLCPKVLYTVSRKRYGSKVKISFYSPDYCHCDDTACMYGKYCLQESVIRVKSDQDLIHLDSFLSAQFQIWNTKRGEESDT